MSGHAETEAATRAAAETRIAWEAGDPRLQAALSAALDRAPEPGEIVQSNRRRTLRARSLTLPEPLRVVVKIHHTATGRHPLRERLKRAVGRSPARREWDALVALHAQGLAVPRPLAWGRASSGDELVVVEFVAGRPLAAAFAQADAESRRALVDALAETLAALARAGRIHGDLHLGNLLLAEPSGRIVLLDHQRGRAERGRNDRPRDLARLELSLLRARWPASLRARLRERLGLGPEQDRALRRFAADHLRGRARRGLRPGRRIERVEGSGLRGLRDIALAEATLLELVARASASPARQSRRGGRAWVAEVEHAGRRYVVKWSETGPLVDRLAALVRGTRAARAFAKGQRDQCLLARAARPLARLDERAGVLPGACWLVLEHVAGVDLDRYRPASLDAALALAHALGDWLAELHALGLGHADLKGSNLRLESSGEPAGDSSGESVRFRLLDLEDLVGPTRPRDDARLEALAQLNASIADEDLPLAAREAFLARYRARFAFDDPKLDQEGARREIARRSLARRHRFRGEGCDRGEGSASGSGVEREPGFSPPSP